MGYSLITFTLILIVSNTGLLAVEILINNVLKCKQWLAKRRQAKEKAESVKGKLHLEKAPVVGKKEAIQKIVETKPAKSTHLELVKAKTKNVIRSRQADPNKILNNQRTELSVIDELPEIRLYLPHVVPPRS